MEKIFCGDDGDVEDAGDDACGEGFHIGHLDICNNDSDYRIDIGWELNNRQDHLRIMFLCDIYHVNVSSSQTGKIEYD